jgi:transcriptional antiterminator RfaH
MKSWYALHTRPQQEARVARQLAELEIETFLPQMCLRSRENQSRSVPYFPCYLFARMDLEVTIAPQWQWTPGLRSVVAFAGVPAVVPSVFVESLRNHLGETMDTSRSSRSRFQPGDTVRVKRGLLADLIGIIEREHSATERVCILLSYLGRVCRVQLDAEDLEKTNQSFEPMELHRSRRTRGRGRTILPKV